MRPDPKKKLVSMILDEFEVEEEIARRDVEGFVGALKNMEWLKNHETGRQR